MVDASGPGGGTRDRSERVDTLFTALADEKRRQVVRYFETGEDDVASVADLVDHAAGEKPEEQTLDQLEMTFHHVTLPKLAELGIVEYNSQRWTVRYRGSPELGQMLTTIAEMDISAD